ncbi:hypothetical protein VPHD484_0233 [Vibrio phage D484]|nr:hypothetical protein MYOV011v1_p0391 [Vibrio phage 6E35.1a]
MSEMEYNKGTLRPVTDEQLQKLDIDLPIYYDNIYQYLKEDGAEWGIHFLNGRFYEVNYEAESEELTHIARATEEPNGDIQFETYHYNGGGHWTEVVEAALKGKL